MTRLPFTFLAVCLVAVGLSYACGGPDGGSADERVWEFSGYIDPPEPNKADLLFVVDSSADMGWTEASAKIELMVRELIAPSDEHSPRIDDLHIGVVTTDMGSGGHAAEGCSGATAGDNGELRSVGHGAGCASTYSSPDCERDSCPWLAQSVDAPDDGTDPANPPLWEDFACMTALGTDGCVIEQPLEASYVALTQQAGPGMPNEGFLRPDSLLGIVYITSDDDCSSGNADLFDPARDDYGPFGVRCALQNDELYPVSRYHDAFVALRGGDEDRVVVAAVAGVPVNGTWNPGDPLERLRDLQQVDPASPDQLLPSCETAAGAAYPPVRLVELVYSFGTSGILESICRDDWTTVLPPFTGRRIGDIIRGCVARPAALTRADNCRVIETLSTDAECSHPADIPGPERTTGWHVDHGVEEGEDGLLHRRCEVLPSDYDGDGCPDGITAEDCSARNYAGGLQGWFLGAFGCFRFTSYAVTTDHSVFHLECLATSCPEQRQCSVGPRERCTAAGCAEGEVCVTHWSGEICGWETVVNEAGEEVVRDRACTNCTPTVGAVCPHVMPADVAAQPVVGTNGCCAEGFHCEQDACVPDSGFRCE